MLTTPDSDQHTIVEVHDLTKTYPGGVEAVKGVDFEVSRGEVFGLLGPNGAGKSTTIGMLTTTVAPTAGTARLAGFDVVSQAISARSVSAVVFQDAVVDRALSGRRNLTIHARLWGAARSEARVRVADVIEVFGLGAFVDRPVASLSGGQRRRLEIARALLSQPEVLFLDEPTVGLDPRIRYELLDLVAGLRDRAATTILLTTHHLDEAERLCDRVAVVHEGTVVALDSPARLLGRLGPEILELRVDAGADATLVALRAHGLARDDAFVVGSTITVPLHDIAGARAVAVLDELGLRDTPISTRPPTLDDVYLRLTGGRLAAA